MCLELGKKVNIDGDDCAVIAATGNMICAQPVDERGEPDERKVSKVRIVGYDGGEMTFTPPGQFSSATRSHHPGMD